MISTQRFRPQSLVDRIRAVLSMFCRAFAKRTSPPSGQKTRSQKGQAHRLVRKQTSAFLSELKSSGVVATLLGWRVSLFPSRNIIMCAYSHPSQLLHGCFLTTFWFRGTRACAGLHHRPSHKRSTRSTDFFSIPLRIIPKVIIHGLAARHRSM